MDYDIFHKELLHDHCLIVDGLSRSGKALIAPLVTNLNRVDYGMYNTAIDHIPILWRLGHMSDNGASAFLRMTVDVAMYERGIGRHLNTRVSDHYSVYNSLDSEQILKRTKGGEDKSIPDQFNTEGRIFSFITHEMTPHLSLWFNAIPSVRAVIIDRHPVDICHSWHLRGWGHRWGVDPMAFIPAAESKDGPLPWFAADFADEYHAMSPPERVVSCVLALKGLYDQTLASLSKDHQSLTCRVAYEKMLTTPHEELERVADWLGTELHPDMPKALERARVPGKLSISKRNDKLDDLQGLIDKNHFDSLLKASLSYEKKYEV